MSRLSVLCCALLLGGCGSEDAAPSGAGGAAGAAGAGGGACQPAPGEPSGLPEHCVREVRGTLAADVGALGERTVSLCGIACFFGKAEATGAYTIPVDAMLPSGGYVVFAHGRPDRASLFIRIPDAPPSTVVLPKATLPLLAPSGSMLPEDDAPPTTLSGSGIELRVPGGTTWELDIDDLVEPGGRELKVALVEPAVAPDFAVGAKVVAALAPFQAKPSKPVGVSLPSGGLPAGTAVELVVMDDGILSNANTGGRARVEAKGHVTPDGARIETDPGEGIRVLTWLAARPLSP